jgi:hypothetical protein
MIADSLGGGATSTSLHLQGDVADVAGVSAEFLRGKEFVTRSPRMVLLRAEGLS